MPEHEPSNGRILRAMQGRSDQEWFEALCSAGRESTYTELQLPSLPGEEVQRQSVGSSGEAALGEAFGFYKCLDRYSRVLSSPLNLQSNVLDFGCGWGRTLRFFLHKVRADGLFGIDV